MNGIYLYLLEVLANVIDEVFCYFLFLFFFSATTLVSWILFYQILLYLEDDIVNAVVQVLDTCIDEGGRRLLKLRSIYYGLVWNVYSNRDS